MNFALKKGLRLNFVIFQAPGLHFPLSDFSFSFFKLIFFFSFCNRAKKVKYHLAQLIDHHTRLLSNAEGIHMQWFNQATVSDKVIFKSMQDALKHAQTFIEAKHLRPQRKRQPDLYKNAESQVEQRQQVEQQQRNPTQQTSAESNPLYKTRLCERFETEGSCPYGPKCNFAHGIDELRGKTEPRFEKEEVITDGNQLFKTKLCEKFMRERFCQYGPKCHFGSVTMQNTV